MLKNMAEMGDITAFLCIGTSIILLQAQDKYI